MSYGYTLAEIDAEIAKRQGSAQAPEAEYSPSDIDAEIARRESQPNPQGLEPQQGGQMQSKISRGEAAFVTATNPLSFGDEIKAALSAGVAKMFGGQATADIDIGDLYQEAKNNERAKLQQARQQYPAQSFVGQIFSDAGVAGKALGAAKLTGQGFKTAVKGGTSLGAASALGETKDITDLPQTAKDVAIGGTIGGLTGGAINKVAPKIINAAGAIAQTPKKLLQKVTSIKPETVQTFKELGIDPTLADVSNFAPLQNFIKDIPGGGKPITRALQKQVDDISSQIQGVSKSKGGTYNQAGKELIKGANDIIDKSRLRSEKLYGEVDKFIPAETPVNLKNTFEALKDRKVQITSAVSGGKVAGYNKFITNIENQIAQGKKVPYDSLTALRSEIGTTLQGKLEPQEEKALGKIYSALTEDIKENILTSDLNKLGKESAIAAWNKANASHRVRTRFIKENIRPLLDKNTPEDVYKYAISGSKSGGTKIGQVIRSLNPNQKEFIRATLIKDLGLAPKTQQGAEGEVFSPAKFLAEWNVLQKAGSEKTIFSPAQINAINKLNKVIEATKKTAQAGKTKNALQLIGLASLGASFGPAAAGSGIGMARITANMMASPKFVNWLATAPQIKPTQIPTYLNQLSRIAAANPEIREEILSYIESIATKNEEIR